MTVDWLVAAIDGIARETMLFAAAAFLLGGMDDLALDLIYVAHRLKGRVSPRRDSIATLDRLPLPKRPGRIAIFVAAWDEAAVIGAMLDAALATIEHDDYRIFVGTYRNDRATIDAVAAIASRDPRVRLVIGPRDGPTTKADCLNVLWRALLRDEAAEHLRYKAVVLHDAEDVVHAAALRVIDTLVETHWAVQLPVLPMLVPGSRLVSGHYLDEFAEAHAKQLVVRQALGAGLPLAGVGCGVSRDALDAVAESRGGLPFDASSLTEDYEMGLRIAALGGTSIFARIAEYPGGPLVAVRAYFPATLAAAVRQKARWMTGIALVGWDRIGWGSALDWRDHWMRMRDRRAPLAVLALAVAYVALLAWAGSLLAHALGGTPSPPLLGPISWLLTLNAALLVWRTAMRMIFTGLAHGSVEALWSLPRSLVSNLVALLAARRAVWRYVAMLRGAAPVWDKTAHRFPLLPLDRR